LNQTIVSLQSWKKAQRGQRALHLITCSRAPQFGQ